MKTLVFSHFNIKNNKSKKLIIFLTLILVFFCCFSTFCGAKQVVLADDNSILNKEIIDKVDEQLKLIDFSEFEQIISSLSTEEKALFKNENFIDYVGDLISGKTQTNYTGIIDFIFKVFSKNIISILPLISAIIIIGILASIITQTSASKDESIANVVHFVCFSLIVSLVFASVSQMIKISSNTLNSLKSQMEISFPILLTLMTALGSTVSVSVYQPLVAILSGSLMSIFTKFVLPLFIFCIVFAIAGNLSSNIRLTKFSSLFESVFKWTIGISFTLFSAFLAVQGITAGSYDGLSVRTTKYAIKSYIPFVGSYIADGLNLILTSSVLIKNAIGTVGLLLLFSTIVSPILKILTLKFSLSLCAGILEPICDKKICDFLSSVAKYLSMLIATICAASFAYLITTGLIMCTGNVL